MSEIIELEDVPAVPATTRERKTRVCDICGKKNDPGSGSSWNHESYEHDHVKIASVHKTHYPEGGTTSGVAYDCCPQCFESKVGPALEAIGMKPRQVVEFY